MTLGRLLLVFFLLSLPVSARASDARMMYTGEDGNSHALGMVSAICGVDGQNAPENCVTGVLASNEYTGLDGLPQRMGYVVPVCGVTNGIPQVCDFAESDYLTKSGASSTYALRENGTLVNPAITGSFSVSGGPATAPTVATGDSSANIATTAFVINSFQSIEYSVQGDISTAGSSIQIAFGNSGLYVVFAYTGSGSASMTFYSSSGSLSPVDIRRNSIWGGSGVETFTLDGGTVTTSGAVADSTVYTASNDCSAYFIRVGGQVYFLTVWASGNGARAFMGVHKMI